MSDAVLTGRCPRCGYPVDAATGITVEGDAVQPEPGNLGLCLVCAAPLEFTRHAGPRWLSYEELLARVADDPAARAQIIRAMLAIVTVRPSRVAHVRDHAG
jgi:hypothetical protein